MSMTLYGATDPQVIGQQISPFFGAQNGIRYSGAPVIPSPNASPNSGPQVTLLEAASRGAMPRNASVSSINGVSTGAQNPVPIDDLMGNGAGNQVNGGTALNASNGNPTQNGAINQEVFVDGVWTANAGLSTGPTPTNTETLTSCPVSGATVVSNVGLSGTFQG
jgi:hypothetical protein